MNNKPILDACCGGKMFYFDKHDPRVLFQDIRDVETTLCDGRHFEVKPDVQADFTNMPYPDDSFAMVVFDPPHIENLSDGAWMRKSYGSLDGDWKPMIRKGFEECMRVLKPDGVLVFKWSDVSISTREILNVIGQEPLFGHRSGKKMNTHWMCFMKL